MLLKLLPELQEQILTYCSVVDLNNFACASSHCYKVVKQMLFHTVRVPGAVLVTEYFVEYKILENLRYTRVLHISGYVDCCNEACKKNMSTNYALLLNYCCNLLVLRISIGFISSEAFKTISNFHNLVELDIFGSLVIDDSILGMLCTGLSGLKLLNIGGTKISDKGLINIHRLLLLEVLVITACRITDVGLSHVAISISLKRLDLTNCGNITDQGISYISKSITMEELVLCNCQITDVGLAYISNFTNLKKLDLSHCDITDHGLSQISSLITIEELFLRYCTITDVGLSHIAALTKLKDLDVSGCIFITELGLSHFSNLAMLKELNIIECDLSVESWSHIKSLFMPTVTIHECYSY